MPGSSARSSPVRCSSTTQSAVVSSRPSEAHRAVALVVALGQHRVGDRLAVVVGQTEAQPAGHLGGHARAGPGAGVHRHHADVAALAGECIEVGVGRDVGSLALGAEEGARRGHQHEQLGAAPAQLVEQDGGTTRLGAEHRRLVLVRGQLDQPVADVPGEMDGSVEPADTLLALVEGAGDRRRVGEIGGDHGDLAAGRFELDRPPDAPARRVGAAVCGEPLLTRSALGYGRRRDDDEVRPIRRGEVVGDGEADVAESAGHEVGAVLAERRRGRRVDASCARRSGPTVVHRAGRRWRRRARRARRRPPSPVRVRPDRGRPAPSGDPGTRAVPPARRPSPGRRRDDWRGRRHRSRHW